MKKYLVLGFAILCMSVSTNVMAGEIADGMGERAQRGIRNFFTGIIEVPMQIKKGYTNGVGFIENEARS